MLGWAGTDDHDQGPPGSAVDATAAGRSRSSCPIELELQPFSRIVANQTQKQETGKRRYYHPQQKDYATFLETSEESGGERTLVEVEVAPDGGTPPHYHKTYEERFEVLEGELEVHVGGDARTLNVGQKASVPTNTLHNFRNLTDGPTTFLVELRPGSAGFEKALKAGYGLASDGRNPLYHPYYLAVLLGWSDMRLPGLFTVAEPVLRLLARRARRRGIDRELEARYCR